MVNDHGQLYTIEGVAAAFLMIFTTYIVLSTTTIYTPADTHVIDMQLEQLGNDALAMMDTADTWGGGPDPYESDLERYIMEYDSPDFSGFSTDLNDFLNTRYDGQIDPRPIYYNSTIYYWGDNDQIHQLAFYQSHLPLGLHPITITRWVYIKYDPLIPLFLIPNTNIREENQVVLLEVTLWRD